MNVTSETTESGARASPEDAPTIQIDRSVWDLMPAVVIFGVSLLGTTYSMTQDTIFVQDIVIGGHELTLPFFGLLPILAAVYLVRGLNNWRYILYSDCIVEIRGRVSFRQQTIRINYKHIHIIELDQTIYQRIVGVGDIRVETPAGHGGDTDMLLRGIQNPEAVKNEISRRMELHRAVA